MGKLFVYRINNGETNLDNTNAGNLEGILSYLAWADERLMDTGNSISLFEVLIYGHFGDYVELTRSHHCSSLNKVINLEKVGIKKKNKI